MVTQHISNVVRSVTWTNQEAERHVTISKVKLPGFESQRSRKKANTDTESIKATISMKDIASSQREAEIATLRGISPRELYAHDLLQSSPLFVGEFTTKADKTQLIAELVTNLQPVDYQFKRHNPLATHILLDFMSKIRPFPISDRHLLTVVKSFKRCARVIFEFVRQ